MFSVESDGAPRDSSPVDQLEQLQAFYRRVAALEQAYRSYLRQERCSAQAVLLFQSSVFRACEALLNGSSQAGQQVFKSPRGLLLPSSIEVVGR